MLRYLLGLSNVPHTHEFLYRMSLKSIIQLPGSFGNNSRCKNMFQILVVGQKDRDDENMELLNSTIFVWNVSPYMEPLPRSRALAQTLKIPCTLLYYINTVLDFHILENFCLSCMYTAVTYSRYKISFLCLLYQFLLLLSLTIESTLLIVMILFLGSVKT